MHEWDGLYDEVERDPWVQSTPWTEKQWKDYYRAVEVIVAKRNELQETMKSRPEDREKLEQEIKFVSQDFPKRPNGHIDPKTEEEYEALHQCNLIALEELPVYRRSKHWEDGVISTLGPTLQQLQQTDAKTFEAVDAVFWRACKVQYCLECGRGDGFADDYLCLNILRCREALKAADDAVEGFQELTAQGVLSGEEIDWLIEEGKVVAVMVEAYIQDLCKRVWWG